MTFALKELSSNAENCTLKANGAGEDLVRRPGDDREMNSILARNR